MIATVIGTTALGGSRRSLADECVPDANTLCMSIDPYASETGYYNFAGYAGSSPDIYVEIGQTYVFDQSDPSNWYHPVGFAYEPDGAHGSTWGGDELPEVEGAGELLYKINGEPTTCADAGDTGLDCYEPEVRQLGGGQVCTPRLTPCSQAHTRKT